MFPRLILIAFSLLAISGCSANAELKVPQNLNSSIDKQASIESLKSGTKSAVYDGSVTKNISKNTNNFLQGEGNFKPQQISVGPAGFSSNYMTLTPTGQENQLKNPIYELRLFANGQQVGSFMAVSGRWNTQQKERNRSGTEAPLPDGRYRVAIKTTRGTIAEAGDRFLPIQPLFKTGRTALGIHVDPSFNKSNGEDGTSGCIGLTNREDLSQLLEYVRNHRPQFLQVSI